MQAAGHTFDALEMESAQLCSLQSELTLLRGYQKKLSG